MERQQETDRAGTYVRLNPEDVGIYVRDVILSPARTKPLVAVTSIHGTGGTWIEPGDLARDLGDRADVVFIETGDATWHLKEAMPPEMDVFGGAVRIWWPGLREDSDPREHPLRLIHTETHGRLVAAWILEAVSSWARSQEAAVALEPAGRPIRAVVREAVRDRIIVEPTEGDGAGTAGLLIDADLPADVLAETLLPGQELPVQPLRGRRDGLPTFSARDLLPSPWERLGREYEVGDVVRGRVQAVKEFGVFVTLLPGANGFVHKSEVDWEYVADPGSYVRPGQPVRVRIKHLSAAEQRCELSIKQGYGGDLHAPISLIPGGRPFVPDVEGDGGVSVVREAQALRDENTRLQGLLVEKQAEIEGLAAQLKQARDQVTDARKDLKGEQDRRRNLEKRFAPEMDPTSSETAFLQAVRVACARLLSEHDRITHPLKEMRVGGEFLARLRALEGIGIDKVIEVCAQVASGKAHQIPGREVHQLRTGEGGAPTAERASDGAKAWRCSLQDGTASARRLHWWSVPGPDGGVVEFASVGVHDDVGIPE